MRQAGGPNVDQTHRGRYEREPWAAGSGRERGPERPEEMASDRALGTQKGRRRARDTEREAARSGHRKGGGALGAPGVF